MLAEKLLDQRSGPTMCNVPKEAHAPGIWGTTFSVVAQVPWPSVRVDHDSLLRAQ